MYPITIADQKYIMKGNIKVAPTNSPIKEMMLQSSQNILTRSHNVALSSNLCIKALVENLQTLHHSQLQAAHEIQMHSNLLISIGVLHLMQFNGSFVFSECSYSLSYSNDISNYSEISIFSSSTILIYFLVSSYQQLNSGHKYTTS